jgi:hypothetical protein
MPSGGYRPGAGRPRKNPGEAKLEGKQKGKTTKKKPPIKKAEYPNIMENYFSMALKECGDDVPTADALRTELETYIKSRGCEGYIAPQTITDYVLNRQGFLACEAVNRKIGRMSKELKMSPYVTAAQGYYRAMQADFNIIMQIINRYGGADAEDKNTFLELLMNRGF